ncbi:MAG: VWA domain-containing protein [Planctomycetes bacterium]|nr:VWA domain-containing protein [Planctomycetota bacterium]
MEWQYPEALYLLWLGPLWIGLAVYARARRRRAVRDFVAAAMEPRLVPAESAARFWLKASLSAAALVCAVLALARPRWGEYFLEVRSRGCDLYVLLDVSKSMLAEDVPPNRLERAKADLKVLLTRLKGERVGLIAFAGRAAVKCPLTSDYGFFRLALDDTDTSSAPRGGTAIGDAIRKALEILPKEGDRDEALLLITDGEDHESYPLLAADAAGERKVTIFSVGLGDAAQGARVPSKKGGTWLTREGQQVWSKMDANTLDEIAKRTNGAFVSVGTKAYDLGQIYVDHLARLRGEEGAELKRKRLEERFQIFLGLALLCLALDLLIRPYAPRREDKVDKKERGQKGGEQAEVAKKQAGAVPAGAAALALLMAASLCGSVRAAEAAKTPPAPEAKSAEKSGKSAEAPEDLKQKEPGKDAPRLIAEGLELYKKSEYEGAREKFAAAASRTLEHEAAVAAFDLGAALQRKGDAEGARAKYEEAGSAKDKRIATAARFNLGCLDADAAKKLAGEKPEELEEGKRPQVLEAMAAAVKHFRECLDLDPNHAGARRNLELLRAWVKYYLELWRKKDQQKRRDEMDLLAFVEYLTKTEEGLQALSEQLGGTPGAVRDAFAEAKRAQDELAEEIPALKEKIRQAASPQQAPQPGKPPGPPAQPDPETAKALKQLETWADEAGKAMAEAAGRLDEPAAAPAAEAQGKAIESLDKIWDAAAPFRRLLAYDLEKQTNIAGALAPLPPDAQPPSVPIPLVDTARKKETLELTKLQDKTMHRTRLMRERAQMELEELEKQHAQPQPSPQPAPQPQPGQPQPPDPKKVQEGLQKAVDLAPKAVEHQVEALKKLKDEDRNAAFLEAEEARKILEEIAKAQPPDPNQQQEQKKDDKKEDQEKSKDQDQNKSLDKSEDPKKSEQDMKDQDKKQDRKEQPKPKEMSKEQAEAILRRVQEREQERRRKLEEFKALLVTPEPVDKDW